MYQSFNRYKVLRVFFDFPNKSFPLRELSRRTKLGLPSVRNHVLELEKEELIKSDEEGRYKEYILETSRKARTYKRNDLLARLEDDGLLDELERKFRPNCIVLYGSAVEGRDDERGDIDFFIQAESKQINLGKYETKLNRKISLLFEPDTGKLNKELQNSLANGITLRGYLKIV